MNLTIFAHHVIAVLNSCPSSTCKKFGAEPSVKVKLEPHLPTLISVSCKRKSKVNPSTEVQVEQPRQHWLASFHVCWQSSEAGTFWILHGQGFMHLAAKGWIRRSSSVQVSTKGRKREKKLPMCRPATCDKLEHEVLL